MILKAKNGEETRETVSPERRQFLRGAIWFGGAGALLLTSASRRVLAMSMPLNAQDLEAARRAQQTPGGLPNAEPDTQRMEASARKPSDMCRDCSGSCTSSCGTACNGCSGGCRSSCGITCNGCSGCGGACQLSCNGTHV